jgi:homoaconitase/3-isopropylmalate dehydratase large subunit
MAETRARTLFDKVWDSHVVEKLPDGTCVLYIDRHLTHEVTSPQAFESLRLAGRKLRRPDLTLAVVDHNIPTSDRSAGISEPRRWRRTSSISTCHISRSTTRARASCISSGRSRVSACPA